jgi:hypothetical protein
MENNQTAMRQLLNQLRDERNTLQMDAEWNRCFQAIESVIESKYIPMERDQIIAAYRDGRTDQQTRVPKFYNRSSAIYYTSTYE